ncbi:MAG: hypothetical protein ACREHC_06010 [Candidatus Levyibacteriota bacterium]
MEKQANQSPFIKPASSSSAPKTSSAAQQPSEERQVMQSFKTQSKGVAGPTAFLILVLMLALGLGAGYGASVISAKTGTSVMPQALNPNAPVSGKTYGNGDPSVFKDTATGTLQNGGIDGEGAYHLVRSGGDSQNVYLTSSSVDLSQFIGKKIKVWGQTQEAQKAGWLMDVGKVEVE